MAKKTKRLEEFRGKPDEELRKEMDTLVTGLFNLRFRKVTDVVENPAAFRKHRVEIAQIKTILRERELKTAKK